MGETINQMAATPGFLGTKPFFFPGGPAGCLLIHGFTGSPPEMEYLGRALAARGLTVSGIQLAGHGKTPEDMSLTGWKDWYDSAEQGLFQLREKCEEIFVAGLSMGGALTLRLCAHHGDKIRAAATLSTAVMMNDKRIAFAGLLAKFMKFFPAPTGNDLTDRYATNLMKSYDRIPLKCVVELVRLVKEARRSLPSVKTPLLIMHGLRDEAVPTESAGYIHDHAASTEKKIIFLKNSGHGVTVDVEKDFVAEQVFAHFQKYSTP